MSYEEFVDQLKKMIQLKAGPEAEIRIFPVTKNNSVCYDSLSIVEAENCLSPAIYLQVYYKEFMAGKELHAITEEIWNCYLKGKEIRISDTSFYDDFNKVKQRVVLRLVNYQKNKKLLENIPHRVFFDLALICYYLMEPEVIEDAAIMVQNEHIKLWGIDEEKLFSTARDNTGRLLPAEFFSLTELIGSLLEDWEEQQSEPPLYVLTNSAKCFGAVWMTDSYVLEQIGDQLREDYYILPSSVHECMVVPAANQAEENELQEMVREINETQVAPEEVLSNTIYHYSVKTGKLCEVEERMRPEKLSGVMAMPCS